jgi:hypothetical protein
MKKTIIQSASLCAVILASICAGCGSSLSEPSPAEKADAPVQARVATEGGTDGVPADTALTEQVTTAVADLAARTGVAEADIRVVQARNVGWGSGAVGCPREDMNYTQAIVPGILLLLEADGKIYRYHGREGRKPFYCPDDRAEAPAYGRGEEFM